MLVQNPAFEFIAEYLVFLLRISSEPMSGISFLDQFLDSWLAAVTVDHGGTSDRITMTCVDQAIVRIGCNRCGCAGEVFKNDFRHSFDLSLALIAGLTPM